MPYHGLDVANQIVLVTGGTSGIGRAIALGFAEAGAKVIAGSTNPEKVAAIKKELGAPHEGIELNVADPRSVQAAVAFTRQRFGRIDTVVNAAGIIKRQPTLEMPVEEFERIIRVNLIGNFLVCQAAGRVMKEQTPNEQNQRGSLVNIASLTSFVSLEGVTAYSCSKAGVMALTKNLANEWAQYGIRANAIAPGIFPTDLNRPLIEGTPRGDWLRRHTPFDRFGRAEELVGAAIYFASPAASFTTGETLVIDGGFLAKGV